VKESYLSMFPMDLVEDLHSSPLSGLATLKIILLMVRMNHSDIEENLWFLLFLKVLTNLSDSPKNTKPTFYFLSFRHEW